MPTTALTQCGSNGCPGLHRDVESGDILVQGESRAQIPGIALGTGESVVAIKESLILEAADRIRGIPAAED